MGDNGRTTCIGRVTIWRVAFFVLITPRRRKRFTGMIRRATSDLSSRPSISRPFSGTAAKGQVKSQCRVDIVNKCLHILLGALIEGNDCKSGTTTTEALERSLVVFNCGATIAGGGDDTVAWSCPAGSGPSGSYRLCAVRLRRQQVRSSVSWRHVLGPTR